MRIGLIADTHGRIHPSVAKCFAGVEMIFHAGDIGSTRVLDELSAIAPVQAVAGNMDRPPLTATCPTHRFLEVEGVPVLLLHRCPSRVELAELAKRWGKRPKVVVHGHTHRRRLERRRDILFVNPGPAGGHGDSFSVAVLIVEKDGSPTVEFCDLAG